MSENDSKWRKLCMEILSSVWKNPDAWIFHQPVIESPELSHEAKIAYTQFIERPMDLRTIKQNIANYESPAEFETDMMLVFANCARFNKPGQDAYEMGRDVEKFFTSKWGDKRGTAFELYRLSVSERPPGWARRPLIPPPRYDEGLRVTTLSGAQSIQASPTTTWRETLARIFQLIRNDPQFVWFQSPVHQYPGIDVNVKKQYYTLIRYPMDFSTIEKNLPLYPSPGEMRRDLELIVTNSVRFNPPESVVNLAARQLQENINELFDRQFGAELAPYRNMVGDWSRSGVKKILPEPPSEDLLPPPPPPQVSQNLVVRLKRTKTDESVLPSPDTSVAPTPSPKQPSILSIDREMNHIGPVGEDWKLVASHLLGELGQIRDESTNGSKLSWIFQKPIFKYELPNQIKRLYLLSVTELLDFQVIESKLENGVYDAGEGPDEFERDVITMLDNCLVFNDETQYPHKVGFVMDKHFRKYWFENGLREKARIAWVKRRQGLFETPVARPVSQESPNWEELRTQATNEMVKQGLECDHISATAPLNDELLYEWRVAQRFVLHDRRNKLKVNDR